MSWRYRVYSLQYSVTSIESSVWNAEKRVLLKITMMYWIDSLVYNGKVRSCGSCLQTVLLSLCRATSFIF